MISDRFAKARLGDWVGFCDICKQKCFASEMTRLGAYTGKEGFMVCPKHVDKPFPAFYPQPVPIDDSRVPWARGGHYDNDPAAAIATSTDDPYFTEANGFY